MQTPDKIKVPFASGTGALKSSIPDAGTTTDETASMEMGFPPRTMSTDTDKIAPTGQDFNGILNKITTGLQYLQAGACYPYDSAFATAIGGYPIGAMVLSSSGDFRWVNTIANNTSNPDTGGAGWRQHEIASNGILYGVASGTVNAIVLDIDGFTNAEDGMLVGFRALGANTTQVTLKIGDNTPVSICKGANRNLLVSDIGGAGYMVLAQYSSSFNKWVMLNPSKAINYVSGRSLFEIFYTMRTDTAPINGAYDCNGVEYSRSDFTGSDNPYDLLVAGKAPTCTYIEYEAEVDEKGSCAKFGLDTANQKFKVPTLTNILQPTVLASAIGEICDAGLPNIRGSISFYTSKADADATGAFTAQRISTGNAVSTGANHVQANLNASLSSPIYRDDINTVQPQTIYARAMVQLATSGQEVSIQQYEQQLSQYAQTAMLNGRILGETIESLVPLTDAGIHLFDGSAIQKSGMYAKFTQYVAGLQASNPEMFVTQAEFDASVNAYGVCSKFVNGDSYIRLPKLYSETRYLVKAWKSGTEWYNLYSDGWCEQGGQIPASGSNIGTTVNFHKEFKTNEYSVSVPSIYYQGAMTGASEWFALAVGWENTASFRITSLTVPRRWSAVGYAKETPDQEKIYRYICVATSVKTPVEVEIDDIITDNNNKADKDFGNVTKPYVVEEWHQGTEWYRVWSTGFIEQGGGITKSSSNNTYQVTLNKPFNGIEYSLVVTDAFNTNNASYTHISNKDNGNFSVYLQKLNSEFKACWIASGY